MKLQMFIPCAKVKPNRWFHKCGIAGQSRPWEAWSFNSHYLILSCHRPPLREVFIMTFVRCMKRPEVDIALDWARKEWWNARLSDGDAFHAADPDEFFVPEVSGEIVGAISAS